MEIRTWNDLTSKTRQMILNAHSSRIRNQNKALATSRPCVREMTLPDALVVSRIKSLHTPAHNPSTTRTQSLEPSLWAEG